MHVVARKREPLLSENILSYYCEMQMITHKPSFINQCFFLFIRNNLLDLK